MSDDAANSAAGAGAGGAGDGAGSAGDGEGRMLVCCTSRTPLPSSRHK